MMMVARYSLSKDPKSAFYCNLGICLGLTGHCLLALLGVSAFLAAGGPVYFVVKLIGALYIIFMGVQTFRSSRQLLAVQKARKPSYVQAFRHGFLTNLLNIKVLIFVLVLFTQVIDPAYSLAQKSIFIVIILISSFVFWSILTIGLRRPRIFKSLKKNEKRLNMVFGSLLIILGLILAVTP